MPGKPASTLTPEQLRERRNAYSRKYYAQKREAKKALEEQTKKAEEVKTEESKEIETLKNHLITCVNMINEMTIALNELKKVKGVKTLDERIEEYVIQKAKIDHEDPTGEFEIVNIWNLYEIVDYICETENIPDFIKCNVDWIDCIQNYLKREGHTRLFSWVQYNAGDDKIEQVYEIAKEQYKGYKYEDKGITSWENSFIVEYK